MKKLYFIAVLFVSQIALAQVTNEATPRGWDLTFKSQPQKISMPQFDQATLEQEDALASFELTKPYRFGEKIPVDLNLFNSGQWSELDNGDRIWRLNIESTGAKTINFLFDRYELPVGAELYLYNNEHTDKIGPYTHKENQEDGILGSWIVYGDNIWLEYYEPAAVKNQGRISIENVVHGYRGFGEEETSFLKLNESGSCNVDMMCDPNQGSFNSQDWTTIRNNYRHAVARIIINGNGLCTGTLVNNVRADATPYFLTANHCLSTADGSSTSYNASNWSFGFDWFTNTPDCATTSNTIGNLNPTRVLTGATLRANRGASDVALFEINQTPPALWNLYYGGWNNGSSAASSQISFHHPSGDIMKLARNDQFTFAQTVSGVACWTISDWDYGVTEGGSSGSCLVNQNGQIVGQLLGGGAACTGTDGNGTTDNGAPDYYGRMDTSWAGGFNSATRLRDWLDPDNTGATFVNGDYYDVLSNDEVNTIMNIQLYPNPSRGIFNVVLENPASYGVYDLSGKLIRSGSFNQIENQLDIQNLSSGIYFLKVEDGNNSITEKISKI
ncbi:T9SS type A sorting domain-containing protein [Nonlabens sp. Asnod3-A02]|uniref:T9SS type A sorting domain-containing protein n=1 Tax=Nonlabens sp. Asnod3-A02 TaxID=3160579 RepID=UPI00386FF516